MKHAKEFLQQKINAAEDIPINKNSQSNTFWQKETSSQPSVIDQQSLDAQVLAYLKASPALWHQLQQAPQEWDKVQQTVKQALQGASYNKNTIIAK